MWSLQSPLQRPKNSVRHVRRLKRKRPKRNNNVKLLRTSKNLMRSTSDRWTSSLCSRRGRSRTMLSRRR